MSENKKIDMDDTNDKIRRNLIVFSALTILLLCFSISEKDLLTRLIGDVKLDIALWKIQFAYISILVYLLIRYRFSEIYTKYLISKRDDKHNLYKKYCDELVLNKVKKIVPSQSDSSIFLKTPNDFYDKVKKYKEGFPKCSVKFVEDIFLLPSYGGSGYWVGDINFRINFYRGETNTIGENVHLKFSINKARQILITLRVYRNLFLYSKTGVEYILPLVLGWVALIWLVVRFISNVVDCGLSFSNLLSVTFSF